jgi:hypothetical protein
MLKSGWLQSKSRHFRIDDQIIILKVELDSPGLQEIVIFPYSTTASNTPRIGR